MSGAPGSSTAGVSTIAISPQRSPARSAHPNGENRRVKRIVADGRAPLDAPRSMLNDRSSILSLLETRRSGKPRELVGPGPTRRGAGADPDHRGARRPTMASSRRGASSPSPTTSATRFAALLRAGAGRGGPRRACRPITRRTDEFAHYAGQLVVLVSAPVEDHKIPVWEQELSCGAAGMNLLLAAHALGFVAGWVTGWRAYSERVRARFLRARRADRGLHLHRPCRPRARGARAPVAGDGVGAMAPAGGVKLLRH